MASSLKGRETERERVRERAWYVLVRNKAHSVRIHAYRPEAQCPAPTYLLPELVHLALHVFAGLQVSHARLLEVEQLALEPRHDCAVRVLVVAHGKVHGRAGRRAGTSGTRLDAWREGRDDV